MAEPDEIDEYGAAFEVVPEWIENEDEATEAARYNLRLSERKMAEDGDTRPWLYGPVIKKATNNRGNMVISWYGTKARG